MDENQTDCYTVVYLAKNGALELKADPRDETIWLTQQQIAELFDVQKAAISKHLKNIFNSEELQESAVVSILETTAKDKKTYRVKHFNLDAVLSVGYRVNSKNATHFRQWANKTLKDHILKGYTINRQRVTVNYKSFLQAVEDVKNLLPSSIMVDNRSILELVKLFANTWLSLGAYDKDKLVTQGATKKTVAVTAEVLIQAFYTLKSSLINKGEATDIFGVERDKGSINGIIGNVMQSFEQEELYPSVEEKAAHLLYFIIKNHPFIDGNKRCGAYAFVWFLQQAGILNTAQITPPALTALTLLIAESHPKDKDRMIRLVCSLLSQSI